MGQQNRTFGGAAALALALGCGPSIIPDYDTATADGAGDTTTPGVEPPGTTAPVEPTVESLPPPEATSTTASGDDSSFIPEPDDSGMTLEECDLFAQDCPEGEKCMPWANDGGDTWNSTRCSPLSPDPRGAGESCGVEGSPTSGIDTCELGAICWYVDRATLEGECIGLCTGSLEAPTCADSSAECRITSDGPLALCIPRCDPIAQDCGEGQGCYGFEDGFLCTPFAEDQAVMAGEACEFINVCVPGTGCVGPDVVPGCEDTGCCTAYCPLGDPSPCLPDQACVPYFGPGQAPPGYEDVGVCSVL